MLCLGFAASAAVAGTIELPALKDNTLYQSNSGSLSNGSGPSVFVGRNAMGAERRTVIAFDVASAVPENEVVVSATLRLRMVQTITGISQISTHVLLADWGEGTSVALDGNGGSGAPSQPGDATWIHTFFPDETWGSAGGDFVAAASATVNVGGEAFYNWTSPQMAADVNAWLDDPSSNFGWLLRTNTPGAPTAKRFSSREAVASFAPKLILVTEPVAEPCPTDLDGSGTTDSADLNIVLSGFGCVGGGCTGDVDGDGDTDSADLNELLAAFGSVCP
jgi:hypothetical protein